MTEKVTIESLKKYMNDGRYEPNDSIDFEVKGYTTDFQWDDKNNDIIYNVVSIESFSLTFEQAIDILENNNSCLTTSWEGTIIKKQRYSSNELEDVDKPAYGGFSNTAGIPEMGELYVDQEIMDRAKF